MADYGCLPLWDCDDVGEIDPDTLSISTQLKVDLMAWSDAYNAALNPDDGSLINFTDEPSRREFNLLGNQLFARLKDELGAEFEVEYRAPFQDMGARFVVV